MRMSVRHGLWGATLLAGLFTAVDSRAAYEFYVDISGQSQGTFQGTSTRNGYEDQVVGLAYYHELKTPISSSTGQASGRRQHSPITVTKRWDAATSQIFQALVTNERLPRVTLSFVHNVELGGTAMHHRIRLQDASVVSIRHRTATPPGASASAPAEELEDVSFTYRSIEVESVTADNGSIVASDDWSTLN